MSGIIITFLWRRPHIDPLKQSTFSQGDQKLWRPIAGAPGIQEVRAAKRIVSASVQGSACGN